MALVPNNTLITDTPEEGRELALKMARLVIKEQDGTTQLRKRLLQSQYLPSVAQWITGDHAKLRQ